MQEEVLPGGNSSTVVRLGDKIHRNAGVWTPTIHKLLSRLRKQGVDEIPEPLGFDEQGREVLSFIQGEVANYPLPKWLWSDNILEESFRLMRRIHDAVDVADFKDAIWQNTSHEPQEVICHNDFAPYNMIFSGGHVVGLIDFDAASPGSRVWDFSYLVYRLIPFSEDAGLDAPSSDTERFSRLDRAIKSYGTDLTTNEIFEIMAIRLTDLADYSNIQSEKTGRKELAEHAAMYRRDAERIRQLSKKI